jgi:hypothetical protein
MSMLLLHTLAGADPYANVGAVTPFNAGNSLDLASYCNGSDTGDDSTCIGTWIAAGESQGKHLYASAGTYYYSVSRALFDGVHIQCESNTAVTFKQVANRNIGTFFILSANFGVTGQPWDDILIENCGFDMNGTTANFASVFIVTASAGTPATHVTVRNLRVFDSTMPGSMYTDSNRQRQYIAVLNAEDVLIENNTLSEGGRIKAGRPGKRILVRNNALTNINDNAITLVNIGDYTSEHYLIEDNTVVNPIGSGIFVGSDGEATGTLTQAVQDIIVRNNTISGDMKTAGITGTWPNHTDRVSIYNNTITKTGTTGSFNSGIQMIRANNTDQPARDITLKRNTISATTQNELPYGGIFVGAQFQNICLLDNVVSNTQYGIKFHNALLPEQVSGKMTGNNLGGGAILGDAQTGMDTSGCTVGCYFSGYECP